MANMLEIASVFFGSPEGDAIIDGKRMSLVFEKPFLSGNGRVVRRFETEDGTSSNGAYILLKSGGILPPTKFEGGKTSVLDSLISGSGVLLVLTGDSEEIFEYQFNIAQPEQSIGIRRYEKGDVGMWVAGEGGLVLMRTVTPVVRDDRAGRVVNIFNAGEVPREYGVECTRLLMSAAQ